METNIRIIINVLYAIRGTDNRTIKKNIILANARDETIISIIKYELGTPSLGFPENKIPEPVFYIAEPPHIYNWIELMDYITVHKDPDDKRVAIRMFIRLKPKSERQMWLNILSRSIPLGNEQYLRTVLRNIEYHKT